MSNRYIVSIRGRAISALCLISLLSVGSFQATAQEMPENLQFYPKDMTRAEVVSEMRHFSFALGVRCSHCHVRQPEGSGLSGLDFPNDDNPNKDKARFMLRMMETINDELLPGLSDRDDPAVEVTCKTCHRGTAKPRILSQELLLAAHEGGGEAAVEKFQELRENYDNSGAYDFGEWETNTVAERLAAADQHQDAITVYRMNAELFPESASIWAGIGESYEALEDIPSAIEAYEKGLSIDSRRRDIQANLARLKGE